MYELIETLPGDETEVSIGGTIHPAPCVVEDNEGVRILVLAEPRVRERVWHDAFNAGVVALAIGDPTPAWMHAIDFLEYREEPAKGWLNCPANWWHRSEGLPTINDLVATEPGERERPRTAGFVDLHVHSEYSAFDGFSKVSEIVEASADDGRPAVAVADHGVCAGHAVLQQEADKHDIKPIFGIEAYFVEDRLFRPDTDEEKATYDYSHLLLWAANPTGLRNLWAMSTEANRTGFYKHPMMDWDVLRQYAEGVMASTACLRGPVSRHLLDGDETGAKAVMGRLLDIFGDRLYAEIHTNQLEEQKTLNKRLLVLADELSVPTIAVTDSHYPCHEDKVQHQTWLAMQTNSDLQDETGLFEGDTDYALLTEHEVREALSYLPAPIVDQAVANTVEVAERCDARIETSNEPPIFSKQGGHERDVQRLVDLCVEGWERRGLPYTDAYVDRFEKEMDLLVSKDFCGYFLMVADYTDRAKTIHHILVGPGRGSGGGSLVAYLTGITEIDPVANDLLFERFLTPGRESMPDFDLDFPAQKRDLLQDDLRERWGADYVVRIGTHLRLKSRGVVRKLASTLSNTAEIDWRDIDKVSTIIEAAESDTAGLGREWEDLWEEFGDLTHAEAADSGGDENFTLETARGRYPLLFEHADRMVGRLHAYGKHAAGFVISTDTKLTENLPLRLGEGGNLVTEFDFESLEAQGYIKFDLLTLRTLDTIQQTVDLIHERHGTRVNVYEWDEEYRDEAVWADLSEGNVLGVFQVEKIAGKRMCQRLKPQSLADLAAVVTLIRPGPMRSGLTDMYLRRRHGEERVDYPHPWLEDVLHKTFACMIYQEDVMAVCRTMAGYDLGEADEVRRILGKKKVEKVKAEGERFRANCAERGVEPEVAEHLWDQMAEFAKYGFNRAHAFGYAMVGYWCAWLKVNYPTEYLAAVLSTVDKDRIPDFVREANRLGIDVLPPDINESGHGFTAAASGVRYGLDSVKGVGEAGAEALISRQPYESWDDVWAWVKDKECSANIGHIQTLAGIGTFDSLYPNRRALEAVLAEKKDGLHEWCIFRVEGERKGQPEGEPPPCCTYDWSQEPPRIGKSGKVLKQKPIPKRCTKACRQYVARGDRKPESMEPYSAKDIREREKEALGVYLSSTPFDDVRAALADTPGYMEEHTATAAQIEEGREGDYWAIGLCQKRNPHRDRQGRAMGFAGFETYDGTYLDTVVFNDVWQYVQRDLSKDALVLVRVRKTNRGCQLREVERLAL